MTGPRGISTKVIDRWAPICSPTNFLHTIFDRSPPINYFSRNSTRTCQSIIFESPKPFDKMIVCINLPPLTFTFRRPPSNSIRNMAKLLSVLFKNLNLVYYNWKRVKINYMKFLQFNSKELKKFGRLKTP